MNNNDEDDDLDYRERKEEAGVIRALKSIEGNRRSQIKDLCH